MKTKLLSLLLLATLLVNAQPDLTLGVTHLNTQNLLRGDYLSLDFQVKNIGTSISPASHFSIYISPTISFSPSTAIKLNTISIEPLQTNSTTESINYICPLPYNIPSAMNYIIYSVDSKNEVVESNENNNLFYNTSPLNIGTANTAKQNLPYPIIFVHGLNGNDTTWYPSLIEIQNSIGLSFGGSLNFCLNQDNDLTTSNITTDIKDWTNISQDGQKISAADFYTINFDISNTGIKYSNSSLIQSNQSAIFKQGVALKKAIERVLNITGKDKVVLVGHSMGGLACREYLQNSSNWQLDNKHHVAKLFTLGTPHGGSNATGLGAAAFFSNLRERSEAVRDLRTDYQYSNDRGVYLFGGIESYNSMVSSGLLDPYYNVDVNCNGTTSDIITGLNFKPLPIDIPYTCVIGIDTYFPPLCLDCDGVVSTQSANLNNYIPQAKADTFYSVGSGSSVLFGGDPWHVKMTKQTDYIFKGADEPDIKSFAYQIDTAKYYFGNFTQKNAISITNVDSDYYKINIPQSGTLNVELLNIPVANAGVKVYNSSNVAISSTNNNAKGGINISSIPVGAGTYYLNIYGQADASAYLSSYAFKTIFTATPLPLQLLDFSATLVDKNGVLKWVTTNEINTSKFDVERSVDGITWGYLGSVNAISSYGINNYTYSDFSPSLGTNHYRLKMIDKDGNYTYSMVRDIFIESLQSAFSIIPNPAKEYALISFKQPTNGSISIFDIQGKKIFEDVVNGNSYNLSTSQFMNGNYIIKITTKTTNYLQQLVIAK